ncbi:MAG: AAA family ATPase [Nostoc sp.]|uniref:AAA family ATPase n=1 Tax=Nostoc sp. TaxID=1180 RepID=UPI002FFCAB84
MIRFLRETWELFYWSLYCPSKLQQRMNKWTTYRETKKDGQGLLDTSAMSILMSNSRFIAQYFLFATCLSLSLLPLLINNNQTLNNWLLLPLSIAGSFGLSFWLLPAGIGWCLPILIALIYWYQPTIYAETVERTVAIVSTFTSSILTPLITWGSLLFKIHFGFAIQKVFGRTLAINLPLIIYFIYLLFLFNLFGVVFRIVIGVGLGVGLGAIFGGLLSVFYAIVVSLPTGIVGGVIGGAIDKMTGGIVGGTVLGGIVGVVAGGALILVLNNGSNNDDQSNSAKESSNQGSGWPVSFLTGRMIGSGIAAGLGTSTIAGIVGGVMASIISLPLPIFLIACGLIAFCLASIRYKWLGVIVAGVLVIFGFQSFGIQAFLVIPVTLGTYYRLLPDYFVLALISLICSNRFFKLLRLNLLNWLKSLPPYTTELLWLPLPNHAYLLANAFRVHAAVGLDIFQQLQALSIPGAKLTVQKALPKIVADQLAVVNDIPELVATANLEHPLLPLLIPSFYQPEPDVDQLPQQNSSLIPELSVLFPRLQQTANDVQAASTAGSAALRERGLERILNELTRLQVQLPGLGFKLGTIKRWQPVIERWQCILQLEIEQQQRLSQGELLNPFQFGNPLRTERSHLFKGRRAFVDHVYRLVLDRNRPTLVLHGPRRCGKTSFLLNLPRLLPSDLLPVYLDLQRAGISNSDGDFCYGLVQAIHRDTRSQGLRLPAIPKRLDFYQNPYPTLEDWLDEALSDIGDRRLLLNLDEFEKIGTAIEQGRISLRLFDELRSLIQHNDKLGFLFSGVQTLNELGPNWSSYFISVVPIEMLYLQPAEAEDLLRNPDPEFALRYDTSMIEKILQITRCQPYLLQLLGSTLVTQANLQQTQLATIDLLQAAIQDGFTSGEPYFTNIWTEFTGITSEEIAAGQALLVALAQGHSVVMNEKTQAARKRLLRYHVIEHTDQGDGIEIPLFEQWVRERAIST